MSVQFRKKIEEQLLDKDGSCRDINFSNTDLPSIAILFRDIESRYNLKSANDLEGKSLNSLSSNCLNVLRDTENSTINSVWFSDSELIRHIQIFVYRENEAEYFVELTFFPQDIDQEYFNLKSFLGYIKHLASLLSSNQYFVRYENASWKFGDLNSNSGVIFSDRDFLLY